MKILFLSAPVGNRTADTLLKGNLPIYTHDGTSVKLIDNNGLQCGELQTVHYTRGKITCVQKWFCEMKQDFAQSPF
jgi:hypothetical protein